MRFRARLILILLAFGAGTTLVTSLFVTRKAEQRLTQEIGLHLHEYAALLASTLDRMIYGRWRDIGSTAEFDAERLLSGNAGERREVLNRLSAGHSEYAWVGFADKAGIVQAASGDLLVGTSVNSRPWFSAGLRGVHAGDVHTATLLSQHLAGERSEPLRFIDISAPVRDAGGQVAGVLAVHLYWDWATETERLLNRALRAVSPNAEVLIAAKDGTVLLGPAALQGQKLDNWASVIPEVRGR